MKAQKSCCKMLTEDLPLGPKSESAPPRISSSSNSRAGEAKIIKYFYSNWRCQAGLVFYKSSQNWKNWKGALNDNTSLAHPLALIVTSPPPGCNGGGCSGILLTPCSWDHSYSPLWSLPKVSSLRPGERPWAVRCHHSMLLITPTLAKYQDYLPIMSQFQGKQLKKLGPHKWEKRAPHDYNY